MSLCISSGLTAASSTSRTAAASRSASSSECPLRQAIRPANEVMSKRSPWSRLYSRCRGAASCAAVIRRTASAAPSGSCAARWSASPSGTRSASVSRVASRARSADCRSGSRALACTFPVSSS
ncbi:hypothetical protein BEN35_05295 [Streptomyces fradiae]|nr:hypothetical protein BEN35_05295 [Streptomyces fradiae]